MTLATTASTLGGCAPEHYPRFIAGGVQCAPSADVIYYVNDAGKNGAPALTGDEAAMVSRIEKYVGRERLEYLPTAATVTIIDDPEPCQHGESIVLSDPSCNAAYWFTEKHTVALPDCDGARPKPWFQPRAGGI